MPLAVDALEQPGHAPAPSAHATASPGAFAPRGEAGFEPNPVVEPSGQRLQCVPFARTVSGVEIYGNANTWWAQAAQRFERERDPEIGSVMAMRGYNTSARGHVAVVQEVISDRLVLVDHANWLNRGEVTRAVPVRDVSPQGDWSAVQVWHVPGGHWGARVYRVQGFIAPPQDGELRHVQTVAQGGAGEAARVG
jgi:hypothetical protein